MINYVRLWASVIKACHMCLADGTKSLTEMSCHHCTNLHLFPRENDCVYAWAHSGSTSMCVSHYCFLAPFVWVRLYLNCTPHRSELHLRTMPRTCMCVGLFVCGRRWTSRPAGWLRFKGQAFPLISLPLQVITPKHSSRHTERHEASTHSPWGSDRVREGEGAARGDKLASALVV